ncbi:hypothetical protein BGZ80_007731 [Entomortierella chlamydospora]|uniref:C2H2-type domain-containing protein n=1 Tax=Entomortierella chlamydospora TaxID=101097 RepID=A0A9P6MYZ9_9FUNG|nr:hypothetical protein BGZ80_007731 [Entomortierella chlamydospora]
MAESTAIVECNPPMDTTSESTHTSAHGVESYVNDPNQALRPMSPMDDIKQEDIPMGMTMAMSSPIPLSSIPMGAKQRPAMLKGSKSSSMLRSVTAPHPLSMSPGHPLQHFQSPGNNMYTPTSSMGFSSHSASNSSSSSSIFSPSTPIGPLSAPSSPSFPNAPAPNSTAPPSFMAMHGHNSSLYEPFRRNSVPILTAEQAEHKRMVSEEKHHMHRQGSWSALSSSPSGVMNGTMNGVLGVPQVLHHLEATHLDPATMHYYRTQFSHMPQHPLSQVIPSSNSNCPSPMPENFMAGNAMSNGQTGPGPAHHSTTGAIRGNSKVKRNNSICSTTSVSSTGSGSNNKHPCKFPSCEWSFKRYEHLKRHMLVHTKERPFQCDFTGCNKSFSRSDNFSAHLRTHSKKALAHRRYSAMETSSSIKQESQDSQVSSGDHQGGGMAGFISHPSLHMSNNYNSNSISHDPSEYGRDYSPPDSPGRAPTGRSSALDSSSSLNDDDSFDMMGHSGYSFGNNSMYSLDHLDNLNNMVPRFDTIRLDLKSVAPGDIHKQYPDDNHSEGLISNQNANVESPRASPMSQYDHFSFPSSISTHFMPMMPSGFSDQSNMQQHQQQQQQQQNTMGQQMSHESLPSNYSPIPSTESFHHQGYQSENDLKNLQFSHVKAQRPMSKFPLKQQRQAQTA